MELVIARPPIRLRVSSLTASTHTFDNTIHVDVEIATK